MCNDGRAAVRAREFIFALMQGLYEHLAREGYREGAAGEVLLVFGAGRWVGAALPGSAPPADPEALAVRVVDPRSPTCALSPAARVAFEHALGWAPPGVAVILWADAAGFDGTFLALRPVAPCAGSPLAPRPRAPGVNVAGRFLA